MPPAVSPGLPYAVNQSLQTSDGTWSECASEVALLPSGYINQTAADPAAGVATNSSREPVIAAHGAVCQLPLLYNGVQVGARQSVLSAYVAAPAHVAHSPAGCTACSHLCRAFQAQLPCALLSCALLCRWTAVWPWAARTCAGAQTLPPGSPAPMTCSARQAGKGGQRQTGGGRAGSQQHGTWR